MGEKRLGRQTPTQCRILPYEKTIGAEAVALYEKTGRKTQEWQELMLYDIMALDDEGLWVHSKYGYSIPRRNGKNEVVAMRELWAICSGYTVMHSAHRVTTSHAAWERLKALLDDADIEYDAIKAKGQENIRVETSRGKGRIEFRTRSAKGGLGEGFDLLVIDEAQEYTDDQETALKYVVSDSRNPQTLMCGTPPTMVSSGTVFTKYRRSCLSGGKDNCGWAEWSVERMTDMLDVDAWYNSNPSMGTILTERKVKDEIGEEELDFNIQRLGFWPKFNQKSAISQTEWNMLQCSGMPNLRGKLTIGIKYGRSGDTVAMSVAVKTADGKILVESIDCRPIRAGRQWILDFLNRACWDSVVVDGANGQDLLADDMKKARMHAPLLPTVKQVVTAASGFEQAIAEGKICHMGQPALTQSVTNCEHRAIGSNGGFGYQSILDGAKIELLESAVLAWWKCSENKPARRQMYDY